MTDDGSLVINASSGVVGVIVGAVVTWIKARRSCGRCPDHNDHEKRLRRLEADNAANVAEIRADIKNLCRSVDELRDDIRGRRFPRRK